MVKKFQLDEFGYSVQLGKFARQADGAVWFQHGGTIVLATAVSATSQEFPGFFPLTVDYREQFSAAGKIPGGYFKREGKPSDKEVLTSRLIDRPIRPLFPVNYFDQVQIIATVYSVDKKNAPQVPAIIASSLALTISKIPFMGPIGAVEICKVDGALVVNPLYADSQRATVRLTFAGTEEGICMVEGSAQELSEKEFIDALFLAHEQIKKLVEWQKTIQREVGIEKQVIEDTYQWSNWEKRADEFLTQDRVQKTYIADKVERNKYLGEISQEFLTSHAPTIEESKVPTSVLDFILDHVLKEKITELIIAGKKRIDGRDFSQIRPISVEVGLLPFAHGSALFTRGRTQALVSTTLGSSSDELSVDTIMDDTTMGGRFMLHYNFPPFSVGEVKFLRGAGRREVGHGYLAASAIRNVLPDEAGFPYTIRIVADMLESDGSTSMATTCGATMSLMDAGVPIKKMVSGVAMGLLQSKTGTFQVLSDISGFEDAYGLMDFKVTGTEDGITAIQMDIKYKGGLPRSVFETALEQAKQGRLHILGEMRKVMTAPKPTLSDLVPKYVTVKVPTDKIGAIIGTGGKTIREIVDKTKTQIDIEPDGLVKIFGGPEADLQGAVTWVKTLGGHIEVGTRYVGKVRRIVDFGLFVELVPGLDGLVHVSNIPREKQKTFMQEYKVDDVVTVEVLDYDPTNGRIRLKIV